jgi:hypothetical protein
VTVAIGYPATGTTVLPLAAGQRRS